MNQNYYTGTVITSSTAELIGVLPRMACLADPFEEREQQTWNEPLLFFAISSLLFRIVGPISI